MYSLDRSLIAIAQFESSTCRSQALESNQANFSMEAASSRLAWHWVMIAATILLLNVPTAQAKDLNRPPVTLTLVDRHVDQDQGAWMIDYRFRRQGPTGVVILPEEIAVKVEGWVSNSRVASHAVPRWSSLDALHGDLNVTGEVIAAADESHRCRERLVISVWAEDQKGISRLNVSQSTLGPAGVFGSVSTTPPHQTTRLPLSLAPQSIVHVRLRIEHQHILYGDYDPLLSTRAVELTLGSATIHDLVPLDREQYLALPRFSWPEPPEQRRDTRHAISGPDSLHIEAHVPGHQYYRYPERPVRYSTKMRLQFWYLIAAGTEGECRVAISQYKDTPTSWRKLNGGSFEQTLRTIGRWTKVERVIQTEAEATTLTLEFKIVGETEIGEMWIDDVSLEPIGCIIPGGP